MGFTKTGDPFVGPVLDKAQDLSRYEGQYICGGYTGHGMPRAFAWCVSPSFSSFRRMLAYNIQCASCGDYGVG
jgi:hypothetical protein